MNSTRQLNNMIIILPSRFSCQMLHKKMLHLQAGLTTPHQGWVICRPRAYLRGEQRDHRPHQLPGDQHGAGGPVWAAATATHTRRLHVTREDDSGTCRCITLQEQQAEGLIRATEMILEVETPAAPEVNMSNTNLESKNFSSYSLSEKGNNIKPTS